MCFVPPERSWNDITSATQHVPAHERPSCLWGVDKKKKKFNIYITAQNCSNRRYVLDEILLFIFERTDFVTLWQHWQQLCSKLKEVHTFKHKSIEASVCVWNKNVLHPLQSTFYYSSETEPLLNPRRKALTFLLYFNTVAVTEVRIEE